MTMTPFGSVYPSPCLLLFLFFLVSSSFFRSFVNASITDKNLLSACLKTPKQEHLSFTDDCATDFDVECGVPSIQPTLLKNSRIIGGTNARPFSWPWQLSMQYLSESEWKHLCGASIISKCLAVTAAHCVEDYVKTPERIRLVAGLHDVRKEEGDVHKIAAIELYPLYQGSSTQWDHDIALLRVNPPFKFSERVSKICLPLYVPQNRSTVAATGWGTVSDGGDLADVLQQVELPTIPWRECQHIYKNAINQNKFCAGYLETGGRDTCQGDSGGPLVSKHSGKFWLSGITSVGSKCALPKKPGIYTSVTVYRDWIVRFLGDTNECLKSSTNQCQHVCVNTAGSYKCECCDGYSLTEGKFCTIECGRPEKSIESLPTNDQLALADSLSFPWMVSIRNVVDLAHHRCAGILIASRWILTAAVCVFGQNDLLFHKDDLRVVISPQMTNLRGSASSEYMYDESGEGANEELRQEFAVEEILLHYRFNIKVPVLFSDYGVALLKLRKRVTYYSYAKPVCLPVDRVTDDQLCMSAGWREPKGPLTMKQVLSSSRENCLSRTFLPLTPKQFCAGNNQEWYRKCDQDLGSPLIANIENRAVAVGIATEKCTPARGKTTYLDLSFFSTWIMEEVNGIQEP